LTENAEINHIDSIKYIIYLQKKACHRENYFPCYSLITLFRVIIVPDRRSQSLEVVIVRHLVTWVLEIWRGEGLGKGLRKGRSVYKQPETKVDRSCHS
jgi:hypothetical protein